MRQVPARTPDRNGVNSATPFQAALLYEDASTRLKARRFSGPAINRFGSVCTFNTALWGVTQTEIASLTSLAANDATDADIVIISLRDGHGLSSSLRLWVNQWITRKKGTRAAMIVLFEDAGPATDFAQRHLSNAAQRAGLRFFTQIGETEGEGNSKTQTGKISLAG